MARRDLETRREALARIDAELTRTAARLEQGSRAVAALVAEHERASRDARAHRPRRCPSSVRPPRPHAKQCARAAEDARAQPTTPLRERRRRRGAVAGARRDARAALDASRDDAARRRARRPPGVLGPLVDHLEIDAGVRGRGRAALGDAVRAVVVDGDVAARQAFERLAAR